MPTLFIIRGPKGTEKKHWAEGHVTYPRFIESEELLSVLKVAKTFNTRQNPVLLVDKADLWRVYGPIQLAKSLDLPVQVVTITDSVQNLCQQTSSSDLLVRHALKPFVRTSIPDEWDIQHLVINRAPISVEDLMKMGMGGEE